MKWKKESKTKGEPTSGDGDTDISPQTSPQGWAALTAASAVDDSCDDDDVGITTTTTTTTTTAAATTTSGRAMREEEELDTKRNERDNEVSLVERQVTTMPPFRHYLLPQTDLQIHANNNDDDDHDDDHHHDDEEESLFIPPSDRYYQPPREYPYYYPWEILRETHI